MHMLGSAVSIEWSCRQSYLDVYPLQCMPTFNCGRTFCLQSLSLLPCEVRQVIGFQKGCSLGVQDFKEPLRLCKLIHQHLKGALALNSAMLQHAEG